MGSIADIRELIGGPRFLQDTGRHVAGQQQCDRVQHEADDEFVDTDIDPEQRRNGGPCSTAEDRHENTDRHFERPRQVERVTRDARREGSHQHLTFDADVPDAGSERHRDRQSGKDEWGHHLQRDGKVRPPAKTALQQDGIDLERIMPEGRHQQAAEHESNENGDQRPGQSAQQALMKPRQSRHVGAFGHARPSPASMVASCPPINCPMRLTSAASAGTSPTIRPR